MLNDNKISSCFTDIQLYNYSQLGSYISPIVKWKQACKQGLRVHSWKEAHAVRCRKIYTLAFSGEQS